MPLLREASASSSRVKRPTIGGLRISLDNAISPSVPRAGNSIMAARMDLAQFLSIVPRGDLWVFGYGSLMWAPEFPHAEKKIGRVHGYHRALCILSSRYRGTPEKPGLVMGLCRGGSCWGMAFRIHAAQAKETLDALWKREMLNKVYMPRFVPVSLKEPQRVHA